MEAILGDENEMKLMAEYKACLDDVTQLDSDMWQSSYVFLGGSVIGIPVLLKIQAQSNLELILFFGISIFGISLIYIWHNLCSAWLRIMHIDFYRMVEIERQVDLWRERYIHYLDQHEDFQPRDEEEDDQLKGLDQIFNVGKHIKGPPGVRKILGYVRNLFIGWWLILMVKQLLYFIFLIST